MKITYLLISHLDMEHPVVYRKTLSATEPITGKRDGRDVLKAQEKALSQILMQLEGDLSSVSLGLQKIPVKKK